MERVGGVSDPVTVVQMGRGAARFLVVGVRRRAARMSPRLPPSPCMSPGPADGTVPGSASAAW